jgi:K+-transporting ATPase ATPase B chain
MKLTAPCISPSTGIPIRGILIAAIRAVLTRLIPAAQFRCPVTFGLYVGSIGTTLVGFVMAFAVADATWRAKFIVTIAMWLWCSLLAGQFTEALAEEWSKARAAILRSQGTHVHAKRLLGRNRAEYRIVEADALRRGDVVLLEANDIIPTDGTVIEGAASVSEAAVTGESAPVLRAAGTDHSSVHSGTRVLSDWLLVRVRSRELGFFDPLITIAHVAVRSLTRNEITLSILLVTTTVAFLISIGPLPHSALAGPGDWLVPSLLIGLVVYVTPVTSLVSVAAIGIFSVIRLMRGKVIVTSGRVMEVAADIDVLVLDKTGTITQGDRHAIAFYAAPGIATRELLEVSQLASLADETPEGRSIVALVTQMQGHSSWDPSDKVSTFHEFSAQTRISGIDIEGRSLRKGAMDAVRRFVEKAGGSWPPAVRELVNEVARSGATPLVVADGPRVLGVIKLRDIVKDGIRDYCTALRRMGIRTIMVTGDNDVTAKAIAAEVGVDDVMAEATAETKRELIRRYQRDGHRVGMCGDGTEDAPALAQADVAMVMESGTRAAKEAGMLVALDSNPAQFTAIIVAGKQILRTRRSLATFSVAAEVSKYLLITPVMFAMTYPALNALNVTRLTSPRGALLSAAIFSALFIVPLTLAALWGIKVPAESASQPASRNQWLCGLIGILLPWVGIKLIFVCVSALGLL